MKSAIKRSRLSALPLIAFIIAFTTTTFLYVIQQHHKDIAVHQVLIPIDDKPAFTLLTFATHQADFLCRLLASAVMNEIPIQVLGYDNDRSHVLFRKIPVTLAELKKRQPDEIVMFVDAFDVVIMEKADKIVSEFLSFGSDIVFSAERGCWPFMDGRPEGEAVCQEKYPASPTPYRYLNSGAWIGYVHAAIKLFDDMMELPEAKKKAIDQDLASLMFLNHPGRITLDYNVRIMQSVHLSSDDLVFERKGRDVVVYNKLTQTYPSILHFNGNGKEVQEFYHHRLGLDRLSQLKIEKIKSKSAALVHGIAFAEVCPEVDLK